MLIAFHKPYGVISQFTPDLPRRSMAKAGGSPNRTLAEFSFPKNVYPIGRLDADSEGLLLLSDEPEWNERLLHPRHAHEREYWAQVERIPTPEALQKLARGVSISGGGRGAATPPPPGMKGYQTLPCCAWLLEPQPEVAVSPNKDEVGRVTPCAPTESQGKLPQIHGAQRTARPTLPPRDPPIRFRKSVPDCWIGLELVEGKNRQVRRMTAAIGHPTLRLIRVRIGNFWLGDLPAGQWRILNSEERRLIIG
jgi:23S rRNA pseudouridine2457 synthase